MDGHIKEILSEYLAQSKLSNGYHSDRIKKIWQDNMGEAIAKNTNSIKFKKGEVRIKVKSSVLRYELLQNKEQIKALFNEELDQDVIEKVIIQM